MNQYMIIIGSSPNSIEEYKEAKDLLAGKHFDLTAIGFSSVDKTLDTLDYMATYHPEDLKRIYEKRLNFGGNVDYKIISHKIYKNETPDIIVPFDSVKEVSGSSALLAVYAAQGLGFNKIILCGCPLEGKNPKGISYLQFRNGWQKSKNLEKDKVRSMSGWTAEFLGKPTKQWIEN